MQPGEGPLLFMGHSDMGIGHSSPWNFNSVLFQHFEDLGLLFTQPYYLIPHPSPCGYDPHFLDEQTEAQKGDVAFTREPS